MNSNIEIKVRVADFPHACALAEAMAGPPQIIDQRDTFFPCARGRLKLREFSATAGELIAYSRPDVAGVKQSNYSISATSEPAQLRETLTAALGVGVVVVKRRRLYLVGQTRIHLDEVEGLGTFLELEVVLLPDQSAKEGHAIAAGLMSRLEVKEHDLLAYAYADLLVHRNP